MTRRRDAIETRTREGGDTERRKENFPLRALSFIIEAWRALRRKKMPNRIKWGVLILGLAFAACDKDRARDVDLKSVKIQQQESGEPVYRIFQDSTGSTLYYAPTLSSFDGFIAGGGKQDEENGEKNIYYRIFSEVADSLFSLYERLRKPIQNREIFEKRAIEWAQEVGRKLFPDKKLNQLTPGEFVRLVCAMSELRLAPAEEAYEVDSSGKLTEEAEKQLRMIREQGMDTILDQLGKGVCSEYALATATYARILLKIIPFPWGRRLCVSPLGMEEVQHAVPVCYFSRGSKEMVILAPDPTFDDAHSSDSLFDEITIDPQFPIVTSTIYRISNSLSEKTIFPISQEMKIYETILRLKELGPTEWMMAQCALGLLKGKQFLRNAQSSLSAKKPLDKSAYQLAQEAVAHLRWGLFFLKGSTSMYRGIACHFLLIARPRSFDFWHSFLFWEALNLEVRSEKDARLKEGVLLLLPSQADKIEIPANPFERILVYDLLRIVAESLGKRDEATRYRKKIGELFRSYDRMSEKEKKNLPYHEQIEYIRMKIQGKYNDGSQRVDAALLTPYEHRN